MFKDQKGESKWVIYILKCKGGRLYAGITNALDRRLKAHIQGKGSRFVRAFSPFTLAGFLPCKDATEARKLEYKIKRMKRKDKLAFLRNIKGMIA
jgi:putative endonuclease